jgi:hypothetical protein
MTIEDVIRRIGEIGIVPVVRAATVEDATRAVEAICAGGIPILEITMTVPNAISVIRHVVREHGSAALIGAGTVTTGEQAEQCIRAGAEFLVSPGMSTHVGPGPPQVGDPGSTDSHRTHACSRQRSKADQDFPLRQCWRRQIFAVVEGAVSTRGPDSDRWSERLERRRLHCRRSVCSGRGWGSDKCRGSARVESGEDHASGSRTGRGGACGAEAGRKVEPAALESGYLS